MFPYYILGMKIYTQLNDDSTVKKLIYKFIIRMHLCLGSLDNKYFLIL